ncbi:hypothetical protein H8930_18530, partial [Bacillus pumilus]|nr:hypothetical protein [Bacillus pumilus]
PPPPPPHNISSAASDVYKRQVQLNEMDRSLSHMVNTTSHMMESSNWTELFSIISF